MKVYVGADHLGFHLKDKLFAHLKRLGYEVEDEGDNYLDPEDDFPEFASRVVAAIKISNDKDPRGILLCGSGQGMAMAANRFRGIYAALAWNKKSARESRNDDNSNILCLPASSLSEKDMFDIVETWLKASFDAAPRRVRRLKQIDEL